MKLKKWGCLVLAACLMAVLLGGCKKNQNHGLDPKNPTTVTVWHYYNGVQQENFDNMLMEFNNTIGREQGIVMTAHNKNSINDLADATLASLRGDAGAEEAPDMFSAYSETAFVANQMERVVDLSQYFTEEELGAYVSGYLEEGKLGEESGLKIFPVAKSTEVMMLNQTDWQTFADATGATIDDLSTWEGLAQVAAKYYDYTDALTPDVPNDGKAFFGRDSVANYMVVGAKQLGMEFVTAEGGNVSLDVNEEAVRKLWDCYFVPYANGYFYSNARFRSDDAKIGDIIAMVCSTTGAAYFPNSVTVNDDESYPIEDMVLAVPNFEGTDPYVVQQGAGMVVLKSEEKKEYACSLFLKWFTEKERGIAFSANSGYLPVTKDANDDEALADSYDAGNDPMADTIRVAVSEIDSYELYAAKPFEQSAAVRSFLDTYIQNTAQAAHDEAAARIAGGEDRGEVMAEYTSDEAFDAWYAEFITGLQTAAGI